MDERKPKSGDAEARPPSTLHLKSSHPESIRPSNKLNVKSGNILGVNTARRILFAVTMNCQNRRSTIKCHVTINLCNKGLLSHALKYK